MQWKPSRHGRGALLCSYSCCSASSISALDARPLGLDKRCCAIGEGGQQPRPAQELLVMQGKRVEMRAPFLARSRRSARVAQRREELVFDALELRRHHPRAADRPPPRRARRRNPAAEHAPSARGCRRSRGSDRCHLRCARRRPFAADAAGTRRRGRPTSITASPNGTRGRYLAAAASRMTASRWAMPRRTVSNLSPPTIW